MRYRWLVFALIVGVLAFVAAGCGGGDDDGRDAEGSEDVTGEISTMAIWGGEEQASFQAVIAGFNELYPNVDSQVHVRRRQPCAACSRRRSKAGNPPDIASDRPAGADGRLREPGRASADRRPARRDRRELRRIGGRRRCRRRDAVRDHVQGVEQVDDLVQRRGLRGGRRRGARGLGRASTRRRRRSRPQASRRTRSESTSAGR